MRATKESAMRTGHQETVDIEVEADLYDEQQAVLRELAQEAENVDDSPYCPKCDRSVYVEDIESGGNCVRCHEPLDFPEDPYEGINSCDALRIIDGVV
jgi:hypothetical protein